MNERSTRFRRLAWGLAVSIITVLPAEHPARAANSCASATMTLTNCNLAIKHRIDPVGGNRDSARLICGLDACSSLVSPDPTQNTVTLDVADAAASCYSEMIMNPGVCVRTPSG